MWMMSHGLVVLVVVVVTVVDHVFDTCEAGMRWISGTCERMAWRMSPCKGGDTDCSSDDGVSLLQVFISTMVLMVLKFVCDETIFIAAL